MKMGGLPTNFVARLTVSLSGMMINHARGSKMWIHGTYYIYILKYNIIYTRQYIYICTVSIIGMILDHTGPLLVDT